MRIPYYSGIQKNDKELLAIICCVIGISAATFLIYWQVQSFDFVLFDDNLYIFENKNIQKGFSSETLKWAFTSFHAGNWHPLTWLSHTLDFQLFRFNAGGHHWTNVVLHVINTILVFFVFYKMSGALWKSGFVAAVFALHPCHVESVAWISERKDLLCAFFWFLAVWSYLGYIKWKSFRYYLLALIFCSFALLSKPMAVTLPFVLLLLDFWPLGRLQKRPDIEHPNHPEKQHILLSLMLEKIPFFLLSITGCIVTVYAQHFAGAVAPLNAYPLISRLANVVQAYWLYCFKTCWPKNLAVYYPYVFNISLISLILPILFLFFVSILVIKLRVKYPFLIFGWLWFLGTLVPVIGLVQVGAQSMADRYTYIPMIGLLVMTAWGIPALMSHNFWQKILNSFLATAVIICVAAISWQQISYWQNSKTLFERALRVTNNNAVMNNNLGIFLVSQGEYDSAMQYYKEALRIAPRYFDACYNVARLYEYQGNAEKSIIYYRQALSYKPDNCKANFNMGILLSRQGKVDAALAHLRFAQRIAPDDPKIALALGNLLIEKKHFSEAVSSLNSALKLNPSNPELNNDMGVVLAGLKRYAEAEKYFRKALNHDPNFIDAKNNLALAVHDQEKLIR